MIRIINEESLFNQLTESSCNREDIIKQFAPFLIDWDEFAKFYLTKLKGRKKALCNCDFATLAKIYSSHDMKLSEEVKLLFQQSNIGSCHNSEDWKEILGY